MSKYYRFIKILRYMVLGLIVAILLGFGARYREEFERAIRSMRPAWIPAVIAFLVLTNLIRSFAWASLLRSIGCRLRYGELLAVWHYSLLGCFIPGSVWMMVGRAYQLKIRGVGIKISSYSIALEQVVNLAAAIFVVFVTPEIFHSIHLSPWIGIVGLPLLFVIFKPRALSDLIWKITFKRVDLRMESPSVRAMGTFFVSNVLCFVISGIALLVVLKLFDSTTAAVNLLNAPGIVSAGFAVGYLSLLTPGGIGVKEGIIAALLSNHISTPVAVLASVSVRLGSFIANGIGIIAGYVLCELLAVFKTRGSLDQ